MVWRRGANSLVPSPGSEFTHSSGASGDGINCCVLAQRSMVVAAAVACSNAIETSLQRGYLPQNLSCPTSEFLDPPEVLKVRWHGSRGWIWPTGHMLVTCGVEEQEESFRHNDIMEEREQ